MLAIAAHLAYEVAAGVAVPLASRLGAAPTAAVYAAGLGVAFRESGRRPSTADPAFAVLNGVFLSAVLGHFTSWPSTRKGALPWLTECEGLDGPVISPYNLILHTSFVAAVGGLVENRRSLSLGLATPVVLVPLFMREAPREYQRLRAQAARHPRWWNRRLQGRQTSPAPRQGGELGRSAPTSCPRPSSGPCSASTRPLLKRDG